VPVFALFAIVILVVVKPLTDWVIDYEYLTQYKP
jgi:hypothetical protein